MSSSQEEILIQIYKTMPSGEIERRLAGNGLIPLARGVADNELQQRRARGDHVGAGTTSVRELVRPPSFSNMTMPVFWLVAASILMMVVGALIMPGMTLVLSAIAVPALSMVFGKAFPKLGIVCGALLLLATAALVYVALFDPPQLMANRLILYFFGSIAAVLLSTTGVSMIHGARHKGSWNELAAELSDIQKKQVKEVRRRSLF